MAKNYTLDRSQTTGWWHWECKDGSNEGWAPTKSEARNNAKTSCNTSFITPPNVNLEANRGYLTKFSCSNLEGVIQTFSVGEINEALFSFFFGLECAKDYNLTAEEKVVTILKIWGIYRGGITKKRIMELHNLEDEQFARLTKKDYWNLRIEIDDDEKIHWYFPI